MQALLDFDGVIVLPILGSTVIWCLLKSSHFPCGVVSEGQSVVHAGLAHPRPVRYTDHPHATRSQ